MSRMIRYTDFVVSRGESHRRSSSGSAFQAATARSSHDNCMCGRYSITVGERTLEERFKDCRTALPAQISVHAGTPAAH
jgi:hypothetical protein